MGYRPTISCLELGYCELGKFYGYVNLKNLKSVKWLIDNDKLAYPEDPNFDFLGDFGPEIIFSAEEFREFITLYEKDINEYKFSFTDYIRYEKPYSIADDWNSRCAKIGCDFYTMYNSPYNKIIEWG